MSTEQEVQHLELSIEQAREMVKRGEALDRLMDNKDFIEIIQETYFEKEAIRLVALKAAQSQHRPEAQAFILKSMDGIGCLQEFFRVIWRNADQSIAAMADAEAELDAISEEEAA